MAMDVGDCQSSQVAEELQTNGSQESIKKASIGIGGGRRSISIRKKARRMRST